MPDVIAIFVAEQGWVKLEFEDHRQSAATQYALDGASLTKFANNFSAKAWNALRSAIVNRDCWITV